MELETSKREWMGYCKYKDGENLKERKKAIEIEKKGERKAANMHRKHRRT